MPFNRIAGIYFGSNVWQSEYETMSDDKKNDEINQVFDSRIEQLNAAYKKAEMEFRNMRLLCDSHCRYQGWYLGEPERATFYSSYIGMIKLQGEWRLCHGEGDDNEKAITWKPIRDASIDERLAAAPHLSELRKVIIANKEQLIPDVERAIAQIAESVEGFQQQRD